MQDKSDEDSRRSTQAAYLRYSHVGLQFFLSVGIFTGGGIWLDRWLGTVVLFTLVGLILGFGGGLYSLYREFVLRREPGKKDGPDNSDPSSKVH